MADKHIGTWGLYARVSDPKQALDGLSVDAQLLSMREWAKSKGYKSREYADRGKSAWVEDINKRPEFKRMLDDARAGLLEGIAVTHIDRFSRKLIVTLSVLGELGQLGVGFVSLENAAFDFSRPADRLLLAVLGAFAQYYSDELSRKIQRGLALRASKGLNVGSLEFGYCNGHCVDCKCKEGTPDQCERWNTIPKDMPAILHPDDAPGVLLAFQSYRKENASYDDIADILNNAGYRSRTPHGRVLWNKHSVAELLRNISYTGVIRYNGQEIPGKHPAIISRELFDEVHAIRRKRAHHQATYNRKYRIYLFGGMIRCSGCGRIMRASTRGKSQRLCYHCTTRELRQHECSKSNTWVYEDGLATQFEKIVSQFRLPDDWRARLQQLINGHSKVQDAENERRRLNERLARVKQQFEWGDLTESDYIQKRNEIKAALVALQKKEMKAIIDAETLLENMSTVWKEATEVEQRDMARAILDEVICDPDARQLIALRPKPAFRLLFQEIPGLDERAGVFEIKGE